VIENGGPGRGRTDDLFQARGSPSRDAKKDARSGLPWQLSSNQEFEGLVDLVGIEPTTFPASRDALSITASELVSIPGSNDATSSSSTAAPVVAPWLAYRTPPDTPKPKGPVRELKLFVLVDVPQVELAHPLRSQCRISEYSHSVGYKRQAYK